MVPSLDGVEVSPLDGVEVSPLEGVAVPSLGWGGGGPSVGGGADGRVCWGDLAREGANGANACMIGLRIVRGLDRAPLFDHFDHVSDFKPK